jgi:hypothetical protein
MPAAGSYRIDLDGSLTANTVASRDHQLDTCWLVQQRTLCLWREVGARTQVTRRRQLPVRGDPAARVGGRQDGRSWQPSGKHGHFLYLVEPGSGKVGAWRIAADGRLVKLGEYPGRPQTVDGDQAPADFTTLGSRPASTSCNTVAGRPLISSAPKGRARRSLPPRHGPVDHPRPPAQACHPRVTSGPCAPRARPQGLATSRYRFRRDEDQTRFARATVGMDGSPGETPSRRRCLPRASESSGRKAHLDLSSRLEAHRPASFFRGPASVAFMRAT